MIIPEFHTLKKPFRNNGEIKTLSNEGKLADRNEQTDRNSSQLVLPPSPAWGDDPLLRAGRTCAGLLLSLAKAELSPRR